MKVMRSQQTMNVMLPSSCGCKRDCLGITTLPCRTMPTNEREMELWWLSPWCVKRKKLETARGKSLR